jgi:hypothetical protein
MTDKPKVRREYTITKFSLHPDGYLHCRITFEGVPYYCTEKEGSWMIPDGANYKEILSPYKEELAAKGRAFRKVIAKREYQKHLDEAVGQARMSLGMGYKPKDVEATIATRFKFDKETVVNIMTMCSRMQQSANPTEDSSDGQA